MQRWNDCETQDLLAAQSTAASGSATLLMFSLEGGLAPSDSGTPSICPPPVAGPAPSVVRPLEEPRGEVDVPEKNLKRVLALEYVDMAGLVPETWQLEQEGKEECCRHQTRKPQRHGPVSSILLWVESYATLVSVLSTHYAEFTGEFKAYQQTIIRAACNLRHSVGHMCYQRKAARCKRLCWSRIDSTLYHEAFMGRARPLARCAYCSSTNHTSHKCEFAPWIATKQSGAERKGLGNLCGPLTKLRGTGALTRCASFNTSAGCAPMVDGASNTTQHLHVHMLVEEVRRREWVRQKNWLQNSTGWSEHHS